MNKSKLWKVILAVLIALIIIGCGIYWYLGAQKKSSATESKSAKTQTVVSAEEIRKAFSKKFPNNDYSKDVITVDDVIDNKYVEGNIGIETPEGGAGARYWAAKINEEWVIVTEAQDVIPCTVFEPYNFPKEMIEDDCY